MFKKLKKILCCFLALSILLLCGCSDNSQGKDKLSNTIWIAESDKLQGIEFTGDGNYRFWGIHDYGDGTGGFFPDSLDKYDLHRDTITFYNMKFYVDEKLINDAEFRVEFKRDTMTIYSKYDDQTAKFIKIDTTIYEYAKTIGLNVPKQGGA